MAQPRILEGTAKEITAILNGAAFAGQRLRVTVDPVDTPDLSDDLPDPPYTVRNRDHLIELLLEGADGPYTPIAEGEWDDIRRTVRERLAARESER